jgi:hypothetical protein
MRKNVSPRKGKQNPEEKNRDSKDAMTKGLQAIAYTAGAVAGLASKTFAGREPRKAEKSQMPRKSQHDPNDKSGKTAESRSRTVPRTAGSKKK